MRNSLPITVLITPSNTPQEKIRLLSLANKFAWSVRDQELDTELLSSHVTPPDHRLFIAEDVLQFASSARADLSPLSVDFIGGRLGHRRRFGNLGKKQILGRALGLKGPERRSVVDATAGLGADSFSLLCLGCEVTAIESSPLIFALLEDGVRRALKSPEVGELFGSAFRLVWEDSAAWLAKLPATQAPDIVFVDPMFPTDKKAALSAKEMQYLQWYLSHQEEPSGDEQTLIEAALFKARHRVVVKRALHAPALWEPVHRQFTGRAIRYDMYLPYKGESADGIRQ